MLLGGKKNTMSLRKVDSFGGKNGSYIDILPNYNILVINKNSRNHTH